MHRNGCGLDVHKATIAACLIREDASGNTSKVERLFGTMTQHLRELARWLKEAGESFAPPNDCNQSHKCGLKGHGFSRAAQGLMNIGL